MKKFTLLLALAATAVAANAQYSIDPTTADVADKGPKTVEYLILSDDGISELTKAGATCTYIGPDDVTNFFYIWDSTFNAGDGSYPGVDMAEGTYLSLEVGSVGWSGGGYFVNTINASMFNDNTIFHCAYMTPTGNGPASIALILGDGDNAGCSPAKFALGTAFNDGGAIYPTIGPALNDDWQGVEISFADLKKIYPTFNYTNITDADAWKGNILSILAGGVTGQTLALDAVYFYNTDNAGIADAAIDNDVDFVVSDNTINVMGGNGIEVYNLAGQLVKSTNGTTVGTTNLKGGVYVARSGNKVQKVVVR